MKVLLTHSTGAMEGLEARLKQEGFEVFHTPLIETRILTSASLDVIDECEWWLFSSRAAVKAVKKLGGHFRSHRLGAVGNGTAKALLKAGGENILVAEEESGQGLVNTFLRAGLKGTIGLPVGNLSVRTVQTALEAANIPFLEAVVYETITLPWSVLATVDVILVASPSAFEAIPLKVLERAKLVALGETTAKHIIAKGYTSKISKTPSAQSIVLCLQEMQSKASPNKS
jgi:uroporphyrinogen-III synthase